MVTSLLDRSKVIIHLKKHGNGKRPFKLGLIVTHGIQTPKTKPTKSPPTRLTRSTYASHGNPLQAQVAPDKPSQPHEPPIPGMNPSSEPPEDVPTCEPEPEGAPMQSTEEPFACPATPRSVIIIDDMPVGFLPPPRTSVPSSPHFHDNTRQEFTNLQLTLMVP
ncbi:hypothetical protein O181_035175 [Austropuccinia psidii MF-1]|uniref:Uncharacterized protein n=1 Tax=Austropuccinia psidii MF-1 TaxID=1389203 RepID=A0A9Q3HAY2_9BASI|nr:hypothetical protein [Austropuccinia psidii MF-1]